MPYSQPGRGDVHVNRPLTNISIAFMQSSGKLHIRPGVSEHPGGQEVGCLLHL